MTITPTQIRVLEDRRLDLIASAARIRPDAAALPQSRSTAVPRPRRLIALMRAIDPTRAVGLVRRALA